MTDISVGEINAVVFSTVHCCAVGHVNCAIVAMGDSDGSWGSESPRVTWLPPTKVECVCVKRKRRQSKRDWGKRGLFSSLVYIVKKKKKKEWWQWICPSLVLLEPCTLYITLKTFPTRIKDMLIIIAPNDSSF